MQEKQLRINVIASNFDELNESERQLLIKAKEAAQSSYAPYSKFHVGAAVLLENGEVIQGSNQENVAYPSGLCAERVTMFYANSKFPDVAPRMLAIAALSQEGFLHNPISPCGSCRQVLLETEMRYGKNIEVLLFGTDVIYKLKSSKDLLPLAFEKLHNL